MNSVRAPAGGTRVSHADPRRLGVHAAISVPGVTDEIPPKYVLRDADDGEFGLRGKVAAAAERGGFVLLVGGSSVGKTRCAFEAVTALLPDWWLVHPPGPGEIVQLATAPTSRTVVWLDELQRYLDGERGLTVAIMRALMDPPHPCTGYRHIVARLVRVLRHLAQPRRQRSARPGTGDPGPGHKVPHRPGVQPSRAGPGQRRCGPGSTAEDRAGRGRVRADPDVGGRATARRPAGRTPRPPIRMHGRC